MLILCNNGPTPTKRSHENGKPPVCRGGWFLQGPFFSHSLLGNLAWCCLYRVVIVPPGESSFGTIL